MTFDEYQQSLSNDNPPEGLSPVLQAMWHQANGSWAKAHSIAQDQSSPEGDWVHAFLHRDEGDLSNAGYWYRRAKKPVATGPIADEWKQLVLAFL